MILISMRCSVMLAAALAVAGCSEGEGGGGGGDAYGAYVDEGIALGRSIDALPRSDAAALPTSGSASYEGVALFGARMVTSEQVGLAGAMELTVDFDGAGDVSGRIHDLVSNGNAYTGEGAGPVTGELTIENGTLDRAPPDPAFNPHFRADLVGTIVDHRGPLVFDARIDGAFHGEDEEMILGGIAGLAGPPGIAGDRINGTFYLEAD